MAGKNHLKSMWDKLRKNLDFEEPAPLLSQVYLGCTQRDKKFEISRHGKTIAEL